MIVNFLRFSIQKLLYSVQFVIQTFVIELPFCLNLQAISAMKLGPHTYQCASKVCVFVQSIKQRNKISPSTLQYSYAPKTMGVWHYTCVKVKRPWLFQLEITSLFSKVFVFTRQHKSEKAAAFSKVAILVNGLNEQMYVFQAKSLYCGQLGSWRDLDVIPCKCACTDQCLWS